MLSAVGIVPNTVEKEPYPMFSGIDFICGERLLKMLCLFNCSSLSGNKVGVLVGARVS